MKHSLTKQYVSIVACSLAVCTLTLQAQADWYRQNSQPDYNPGFGEFPPAMLEQELENSIRNNTSLVEDNYNQDLSDPRSLKNNTTNVVPPSLNRRSDGSATQNYWRSNRHQKQELGKLTPGYNEHMRNSRPDGDTGSGMKNPWSYRGLSKQESRNKENSGFNPWGRRGGWSGNPEPFSNRSPGEWLSPKKKSLSRNWDDMLNTPNRMGEMPGGWEAPSISAPNPVDVADEIDDTSRDLPDQINSFKWNDRYR